MDKDKEKVTKEKEIIYETKFVDKNIPTISFSRKDVLGTMEWGETTISVSDSTAEKALKVFKDVLKELYSEKI